MSIALNAQPRHVMRSSEKRGLNDINSLNWFRRPTIYSIAGRLVRLAFPLLSTYIRTHTLNSLFL